MKNKYRATVTLDLMIEADVLPTRQQVIEAIRGNLHNVRAEDCKTVKATNEDAEAFSIRCD